MPAGSAAEQGIRFVTASLRGVSFQVTLSEQRSMPRGICRAEDSLRHDAPLGDMASDQSVFKSTRGRGSMFHSR